MTVDALGRELAERGEQLVDLLRHEHGGRLVEDEDPGAAVEHLEDLDPLALADAEVARPASSGSTLEAVRSDRARAMRSARPAEVDARPAVPGSSPRIDVLPDGEVVGEHEVLVHHADADGDRVRRRLEVLLARR